MVSTTVNRLLLQPATKLQVKEFFAEEKFQSLGNVMIFASSVQLSTQKQYQNQFTKWKNFSIE
jgi:hypothetical protein